ncbi:MAG: hypothetical protein COA90_06905 [Gammaproteobacteria bacterium]|nr:MAG: hypothetical protein COA90_06905 [Gammaproteobacteria bacterium]
MAILGPNNTENSPKLDSSPKMLGILLGILYGIAIRLVWDLEELEGIGELVTISFMFLVPFVIGFIRVYFEEKANTSLTVVKMLILPWLPIFIFLLTTLFTLLEGSICVIMAAPAFLFCASLGGLTAGLLSRAFKNKGTLSCVAILPLVVAPLELNYLESSRTYEVINQIEIDSSPEVIWSQLGNIEQIEKHEIPSSLTTLIGIPTPISAQMSGLQVGSVRTSRWEKGIVFKEVITEWSVNKRMAYDFDIDPDVIPDDSLDKHVKLGGEYFSPLSGKYEITSSDQEGKSILSLSTIVRDDTNFGIYSRVWGQLIFSDFHTSLLGLIKNRAENISSN